MDDEDVKRRILVALVVVAVIIIALAYGVRSAWNLALII